MTGLQALLDLRDHRAYRVRLVLPGYRVSRDHRVFRDRLDLPGLLAHRVSRGRLGLPEQPEPPEQPELPDLPE